MYITYKCGHTHKGMIVMNNSSPAFASWMVWKDRTGFDGDKSECFDCFLERVEKPRIPKIKPLVGVDETIKGDPKRFYIVRNSDESGISGTGRVLDGVLFPGGKTVIKWRSKVSSVAIYETFEDFKLLHIDCHPTNATDIVWLDSEVFPKSEVMEENRK